MEIQVRTHRKLPDNANSRCSKTGSCISEDCRSSQQSNSYVRSYGLSVKIRPSRSLSQPAPRRRPSNPLNMDTLTEKTTQDEKKLDSTQEHVEHQPSETDACHPVELSSLDSSCVRRNDDLFDQLVQHFGSKSTASSYRGRSRKRQRSSFYISSNRRQSNSSNRRATLCPGSGASLHSTGIKGPFPYVKPSLFGNKSVQSSAYTTLERTRSNTPSFIQQTSTPDSTLSDNNRIRDSNLRVSRIRAISTSSVEFSIEREQQSSDGINCSSCSSRLDNTESQLSSESESLANELSALPNKFDSKVALKRKSSKSESQTIQRSCAPIYLCPTRYRMLRSHNRRSLTPDPRQSNWYRGSPDSTRSFHSEYRNSSQDIFSQLNGSTNLDYMTADSIDRRRLRKRKVDKFSASIQSIYSSNSSLPPRSKSSLGVFNYSGDWGASPSHDESTLSVQNESSFVSPVFYVDKNGRIRQRNASRSNCSTPPIPTEWMQQNPNKEDITICSIDSSGDQHTSTRVQDNEEHSTNRRSAVHVDKAKKSELGKSQNVARQKLESNSTESLNYSRLSGQDEEELMSNLIAAMKELKDIAEVARVIDEVDDEEWLIVFIGELEHRLRGFISMHVNENEETYDYDVLAREKVTLFSVLIDLIRFLKDRSAYRIHRRQSPETNGDGIHSESIPAVGEHVVSGGRNADGTLQRLKKMAAIKPVNPFEMQRWQRQLMNLAGILEKYLDVLENRKAKDKGTGTTQDGNESTEQAFSNGRSDYSSGSQDPNLESDRRLSARSQASSGISTISHSASLQGGRTARQIRISKDVEKPSLTAEDVPSNGRLPLAQHNVNNNNNNTIYFSSSPVRRLPVIDLRSVENGSEILEDISPPTICSKGGRFPQTQEEEDSLYRKRDCENLAKKGALQSSNLPRGRVVSAYCRIPHDARKRSASISNLSDLRQSSDDVLRHVSEFRMTIGTQRGRDMVGHQSAAARARSCDNLRSRRSGCPDRKENLQMEHQSTPIRRLERTGARPKIRQIPSASQHEVNTRSQKATEYPKQVITSSSSTQCDLDVSWRQREKMAEDRMKQLKRRADILKRSLNEAREDRDEKERKIAVLQAKLERSKKNMMYGESEKGAIEEEVDRLKKLLKESTKDSDDEIARLKKRLEELEKKLEKETDKYKRMEETVARLQQQLSESNEQCELMSKGKCELEERIRELMVALMQQKEHNRQMQEENTRLEEELLASNQRLNAIAEQAELNNLNNDLHQRLNISETTSRELEQTANELRGSLETAEIKIDELSQENHRLVVENEELTEALACEQMMTKEATNCFYEQVNYLNHELTVKEEAKNAQAAQYDKEIARILFEQGGGDSLEIRQEMEKANHELEEEKSRLKRLEEENDELQQTCEELKQQQQATSADQQKTSNIAQTEDKAIQAEDTCYMRMQAFDFYTREAQRDGRRLAERGRQLELEARQKLRESREAMRQINSRDRVPIKNPK